VPFQFFERNAPPVFDSDSALVTFLLQSQPGLVFIKDEMSRLVYANEAFLGIYAPEQRGGIIGTTTVESFTAEEAALFLSEDRRAFREGHSEMVEEVTDWTGRKISLLSRKVAVTMANGEKRLVCFSTDITELAARERRLVRLNAQLKVYSHSVAHDLKNPIAAIIAGLNLIERDSGSVLKERSAMVLESLRASATGLAGFVSSLLKAAAAETQELAFERYDLNLLLEEVRFNLSALIEGADAELHVTRLPILLIEPNLLRQLFQNLIENSVKHAGADRLVVTIHYKEAAGEHVFYVGDNGTGIPPEKKDLVFSQFYKGENSDGIGLGLATCQRIAHLHDGVLELHDKIEQGCCMVLRLPKDDPATRSKLFAPALLD